MVYRPRDFVEPNVCVDENLTTDDAGLLRIQPHAVPRLVIDQRGLSGADGKMYPVRKQPGKLLINIKAGWRNDGLLEVPMRVRIIRGPKSWITSNPNAIRFTDRFNYKISRDGLSPEEPITTSQYDSKCGSAIDLQSNSVAEPNPGKQYAWQRISTTTRWIDPVPPGEKLVIWFQMYVWTPDPWSDNANKNSPEHKAFARWARLQVWADPVQGSVVTG